MRQDTIQDLQAFNEQIFDIIQEYVENKDCYPESPALIINTSSLQLCIDGLEDNPGCDIYPLSELTRIDDDGSIEPDADATFDIASKYIFVR